MRYWLLTTEFPPFSGGGISTYCGITASSLAKKEIAVTVFVPDESVAGYSESILEKNVCVVRFNPTITKMNSVLGYTANLSYAFALMIQSFVEMAGAPDYIEAQDYLGIAYYLQQFKLTGLIHLSQTPIIITLHSPAFIYLEYNRVPTYRFPEFWTCEMEKNSIISADIIISPSQFLIKEISRYIDISKKQVHILQNPFKAKENNTNPYFIKNKIVYYGKLSAQKGSFKLFEYFDRLWRSGFCHPLTIIGGTDIVYYPEQKTMLQLVKRKYGHYINKGLLRIEGKINYNEITSRLNDAHVVIVPSIVDNLPYVVLECQNLKRVVLASVQGGQSEIIEDGKTGFLFDHNDENNFAVKLDEILRLDNEGLTQIAENGFENLHRYNEDDIIIKKLQIIQNYSEKKNQYFPYVYQEKEVIKEITDNYLLSVIIPFYNMGKYIEECIQSIISSNYAHKEIIIVNDGSTDADSIQKLEELAVRYNVLIINQVNKGLAESRNIGAKNAKGRFLAFVDADDKVAPSYFAKTINLLQKYPNVFFVGCWVKYFENSNNVWPTYNPQPPYLLVHNTVNSSALVYERKAFLENGLNDKNVDYGLEDYESVINMVKNGYNGIVIPEVNFYYRVRSGSMIRGINKVKWLYSYKYMAMKHANYYAKHACEIINLLNANGPGYLYDNPTLEHGKIKSSKYYRALYPYIKRLSQKYPYIKTAFLNIKQLTNINK